MARILVVEDTPDNMKLLRAVLRRQGHEIAELADGNGLIELVRRFEPDLILLDIQLPVRDGFELLAEIRAMEGGPRKVAALTAHAFDSDRARAIGAGFDGYITKPIDVRDFPRQVEHLLASSTARMP
jgi:CheY-like chemotaxis protein